MKNEKKIFSSAFSKNILSMMIGTLFVQSVPIITSLLIARLYLPAQFGLFSAWLAIMYIVATILTCRYDTALAIVEDDKRNEAFFGIILVIFAVATILLIGIQFGEEYLLKIDYVKRLPSLLLLILAATSLSVNVVFQNKVAADGLYKNLIKIRLLQALLIAFFQVFLGVFEPGARSLCFGFIVGNVLSLVFSPLIAPIKNINPDIKVLIYEARDFLLRYRRFAIIGLPASTINVTAVQLPIIVLAFRFGDDVVGVLALTMRVLGAPIGLVGKAVLDVFKRTAANAYKERGECRAEYLKAFKALLVCSVIFSVCTVILAEDIFVFAYGEKWRMSGELAIILLPLFAMRFLASPLSYMAYIAERQSVDLYWQICLFLMTLLVMFMFDSFSYTISVYSVCYAMLYFSYLIMSYKFSVGKGV